MATFLSKYGVARHIYVPMVKRAVVDFAVGADWNPAAGDVKISKDGAAAVNVTNLPVAIAMGNGAIWDFAMTATEMQAAQIMVTVADSATKAVEDQYFSIETYGNINAEHIVDWSQALPANFSAQSIDATGHVSLSNTGSAQLTEDYAAVGTAPTLNQAVFAIMQLLAERSVSGTTLAIKKLDRSTTAMS